MESLNELKKERDYFRNNISIKNKEYTFAGLNFSTNEKNHEFTKDTVVDFFIERGFSFTHPNAPSPRGIKDGFTIYISSVVSNEDHSKNVAIMVSIHHEDEKLINREERQLYF